MRNFFFYLGVFPSKQFDIPVITVGNLNTGGTGKSPMAGHLLKLLSKKHKVALLSRGYGRKTKGFLEVQMGAKVEQTGDEPLMLKLSNAHLPVAVDENRVHGIETLLKQHKDLEVIVLDDAFQHRYVKAGLNIILTTYKAPFYSDFVLPSGNLRELRKNAARAQVIVVTKCPPDLKPDEMQAIRNRIKNYSGAYVFFAGIVYGQPVALQGGKSIDLKDHSVLLVTGIAAPQPLFDFCRQQAAEVQHLAFADHYSYKATDYTAIAQKFDSFAAANKVILTTHKDAVKWQGDLSAAGSALKALPVFYQPIEVVILDQPERFNALIQNYVESNQPNR